MEDVRKIEYGMQKIYKSKNEILRLYVGCCKSNERYSNSSNENEDK